MPTAVSIAHQLWTADEFLDWLEPGIFADLIDPWVAEILSPTTAGDDVGRIFARYEEYGVKEFWILDPKTLAHRFFSRQDNLLLEFGQNEDIICSRAIPGLWVRRAWLDPCQMPDKPTVSDALGELISTK